MSRENVYNSLGSEELEGYESKVFEFQEAKELSETLIPCKDGGCDIADKLLEGKLEEKEELFRISLQGNILQVSIDMELMDLLTQMRIQERLNHFLQSELDIIQNGY